MDKEDVVYIYNGILLSHKNEWNFAICNNMDGPGDCHAEWSKSEREKQISYINAYMWSLKNATEWQICKSELETKLTESKNDTSQRSFM